MFCSDLAHQLLLISISKSKDVLVSDVPRHCESTLNGVTVKLTLSMYSMSNKVLMKVLLGFEVDLLAEVVNSQCNSLSR